MEGILESIEFRGKQKDNGSWIYGFYIVDEKGASILYRHPLDGSLDRKEVYPETVNQYIRSKDKNNKKIYQGDILKYDIHPSLKDKVGDDELLHQVVWAEHGFYLWRWRSEDMNPINPSGITESFEIVGNIHDNPELL